MNLLITSSETFDRTAALEVAQQVQSKPDSVLGSATGNTTIGLHRELCELFRAGQVDFSKAALFQVDEYAGISPTHPTSCQARMENQLLNHINIEASRIFFPNHQDRSPEEICTEFENQIHRLGGLDLQILGIGTNGHIGFNEPGTPFESITHVTDIAVSTVQAKANAFGSQDQVPRQGITMGIKTVMHAKRILLLAKGADKASIIRKALSGPVTVDVPASVLQLHPDLTVVLDESAATEWNHQ